jgi:hypothetical protein
MRGEAMAVMDYQTQDGLAYYGFSIEFRSDVGWRVYIAFHPFCRNYDDSLQLPYQAVDGNGRRYVSWPSKLDSLGDAKTVAALWAELICKYEHIDEQRNRNNAKTRDPNTAKQLRVDAA